MSNRLVCERCGEVINKDTSKPWKKHYCPRTCSHLEFECFCNVNRLTNNLGEITGFTVDIQVKCKKCEHPFRFIGLPMGLLHNAPTMGMFGYEARLPIEPIIPTNK